MKHSCAKIFAVILVALFVFAACGEPFKAVEGGPAANETVYGNGGLTVRKGDYLFAINGTGMTSSDNTYGNVVKASIIRQNLNDLKETPVVVVPKLALSSYAKGGFYIFGDRIYYATPSDRKDSKGNVLTGSLDFFSVKTDGTDNKRINFVSSSSTPYRFYENDKGTVYLIYAESAKIYTVDTSNNKSEVIATDYTGTPVFANDGFIYYNKTLYKTDAEETDVKLPYEDLISVKFDGSSETKLKINNKKLIINDKNSDDENRFNIVTLIDVLEFNGKTTLFYTRKSTAQSNPQHFPDAITFSYVLDAENEVQIDADSTTFTDRIFLSPTSFIATIASKSLVTYVEAKYVDNILDATNEGKALMQKPSKILFTLANDIYYLDSSNNLNKKQYLGQDVSYGPGEKVLEDVAISVSTQPAELVEFKDKTFMFFIRNDGYYPSYVYAVDLKAETLEATFIGVATDADDKAAKEKMEADEAKK